jgi:6-phosphogluconolactonase
VSRNEPEIIISADSLTLYSRAAAAFISLANASLEKKGHFTVALSGGSTPLPLYGILASEPFRNRINWAGVYFFWSDERCVPPDDEDSNYGKAAAILLEKIGVAEEHIHRIKGELGEEAAGVYETELKRAFGLGAGEFPVFDLMLLGMGVDGHTASLFPGSAIIDEEKRLAASTYVKKLASTRVTLTPPVIKNAANISFLVKGGEKAPVLKSIMEGPFDCHALPSALTLEASGKVKWFVDKEAASLLSG